MPTKRSIASDSNFWINTPTSFVETPFPSVPTTITNMPQPTKTSSNGSYLMGGNAIVSSRKGKTLVTTAKNATKFANVSVPAAVSTVVRGRGKPRMRSTPEGIRVVHSELIGVLLSSSTAFTTTSFVINPGRVDVFPWLSNIASNYDQYRMHGLKFRLVSSTGTSNAGKAGLSYDYDSTDPVPLSRVDFYAMSEHVEGPVWANMELVVPCNNKLLFVNTHTNTDSKLIDNGMVVAFVDGFNGVVADIIVEYDVTLVKPQQSIYASQEVNVLTGVSAGTIISRNWVISPGAGIQISNMPIGKYMINYVLFGTVVAKAPASILTGTGTIDGNLDTTTVTASSGWVTVRFLTAGSFSLGLTYTTTSLAKFVITRVAGDVNTNL
jgi:hypothetical protein